MSFRSEEVLAMAPEEYHDFETFMTPVGTTFPTSVWNISNELSNSTLAGRCKWNSLNTGMTALLLLTFVLNGLASIVLFRVPLVTIRGRSNPVYFCIRFLNVCDVLQAFVLIIMPAFATSDCGWLGGKLSCSIMGFIVLFFLLVSPLITILMAFDRVVALYRPFKYRSNLGLKMLKVSLPSACVFVLITTILPIFGVGDYHVVKGRRFCLLDTITDDFVSRSYVIAVHVVFLLALLFMLSCTIAFQSKLVRMSFTKKHKESKSKSRSKVSSRRTRNATLTTMAVCGIFIICYLPYVIRVLVEATTLQKSPGVITWMTFGLAFLQPLLNPIVYIATNTRYRHELKALCKNIKVSEFETSSESGPTHNGSRGPFAGFRKRLSSGGSRNSKRGSKRKHLGSKNSLNNSATSPPQLRFAGKNGVEKQASWKRQSKTPGFIPENCFIEGKATKIKTVVRLPKPEDQDKYREPSSSSGVKSCDSVERMLLTPPAVASSLALRISNNPEAFAEYGRPSRPHLATFVPQTRKRSNTVSEGESSQAGEFKGVSRGNSASTPALLDCGETAQSLHGSSSINILAYDHSPKTFPSSPVKITDAPFDTLLAPTGTLPAVKIAKQCSGCSESENDDVFLSFPDTSGAAHHSSNSNPTGSVEKPQQLKRSPNRPSYKRALEMTSRYLLSRKPSKRDSGVGDS